MHKLTPLWCMLPESGLNWRARLMKPSHEMYFVFTVTSTACSSSRTRFLPGLCSLYYHTFPPRSLFTVLSHVSSQVFVHCTITHTFPPRSLFTVLSLTRFLPALCSLYYHSHILPRSLFTVLSFTHYPLCLYSLYYHSHLSPYVCIHCTITHTFPPMSVFTVLSLTPFPLCLYSLYYHSHIFPQVLVHCTITHTFPPTFYSLCYHSHTANVYF